MQMRSDGEYIGRAGTTSPGFFGLSLPRKAVSTAGPVQGSRAGSVPRRARARHRRTTIGSILCVMAYMSRATQAGQASARSCTAPALTRATWRAHSCATTATPPLARPDNIITRTKLPCRPQDAPTPARQRTPRDRERCSPSAPMWVSHQRPACVANTTASEMKSLLAPCSRLCGDAGARGRRLSCGVMPTATVFRARVQTCRPARSALEQASGVHLRLLAVAAVSLCTCARGLQLFRRFASAVEIQVEEDSRRAGDRDTNLAQCKCMMRTVSAGCIVSCPASRSRARCGPPCVAGLSKPTRPRPAVCAVFWSSVKTWTAERSAARARPFTRRTGSGAPADDITEASNFRKKVARRSQEGRPAPEISTGGMCVARKLSVHHTHAPAALGPRASTCAHLRNIDGHQAGRRACATRTSSNPCRSDARSRCIACCNKLRSGACCACLAWRLAMFFCTQGRRWQQRGHASAEHWSYGCSAATTDSSACAARVCTVPGQHCGQPGVEAEQRHEAGQVEARTHTTLSLGARPAPLLADGPLTGREQAVLCTAQTKRSPCSNCAARPSDAAGATHRLSRCSFSARARRPGPFSRAVTLAGTRLTHPDGVGRGLSRRAHSSSTLPHHTASIASAHRFLCSLARGPCACAPRSNSMQASACCPPGACDARASKSPASSCWTGACSHGFFG